MKKQDAKIRDGRYVYNLYAYRNKDNGIIESVLEFNLLKRHLLHFLDTYKENVSKKDEYTKIGFGEIGSNITESTSDTTVSKSDSEGHES